MGDVQNHNPHPPDNYPPIPQLERKQKLWGVPGKGDRGNGNPPAKEIVIKCSVISSPLCQSSHPQAVSPPSNQGLQAEGKAKRDRPPTDPPFREVQGGGTPRSGGNRHSPGKSPVGWAKRRVFIAGPSCPRSFP
jgi:hypothetical protein